MEGPTSSRADIGKLRAIMAGIASDGELTDEEAVALAAWLDKAGHLRGSWPYDDVVKLLQRTLADLWIDPQERSAILLVCNDVGRGRLATRADGEGLVTWAARAARGSSPT